MYKIYGRFVDEENKTKSYYLIGDNGEKLKASIKYVTDLAGRGLVDNAKTQSTKDGTSILRGKLVNLTKLPVIVGNIDGIKIVGDSKITGIIYKKRSIAGYVIINANGNKSRLSYKKVVDLVADNYIGNAEAIRGKNGEVLIKCNATDLDTYYMDSNNKIFKVGKDGVKVRAIQQKNGGIINDVPFNRGDWLVCSYLGEVKSVREDEFKLIYKQSKDEVAICDLYLDKGSIKIKRFDTSEEDIEHSEIKSWLIFKQCSENKEKC